MEQKGISSSWGVMVLVERHRPSWHGSRPGLTREMKSRFAKTVESRQLWRCGEGEGESGPSGEGPHSRERQRLGWLQEQRSSKLRVIKPRRSWGAMGHSSIHQRRTDLLAMLTGKVHALLGLAPRDKGRGLHTQSGPALPISLLLSSIPCQAIRHL